MSNPSTVWTQLSLPLSPVGSIPFVDADKVSIDTDVTNFQWDTANLRLNSTNGMKQYLVDKSATPGAATINRPLGRVKLAAGQTSLVVTNNLVDINTIIRAATEGTPDATATSARVSAQSAGSFTITANAAATGAVVISFYLLAANLVTV